MNCDVYNAAINNIENIGEELEEVSLAYKTLGDEHNAVRFGKMFETVEEALDEIQDFVSSLIAPPSEPGNENVIEQ